jgi:hypothetical protein
LLSSADLADEIFEVNGEEILIVKSGGDLEACVRE